MPQTGIKEVVSSQTEGRTSKRISPANGDKAVRVAQAAVRRDGNKDAVSRY